MMTVKVKLSLCFINQALRHDDIIQGSGSIAPPFLTSALDKGELSASRLGCFTPGEIAPWYPLDTRLGGTINSSLLALNVSM
jgi:hypothetical protein